MSDIALFAFGGAVFTITTWATIAFGLARVHQLQRADIDHSSGKWDVREGALTEVYITEPTGDEPS